MPVTSAMMSSVMMCFGAIVVAGAAGCGGSGKRVGAGGSGEPQLLERNGPGQRVKAVAWAVGGVIVAMNRPRQSAEGAEGAVGASPTGNPVSAAAVLSPLDGIVEAPERWSVALIGAAGPMGAVGARIVATEQAAPGTASALLIEAKSGAVSRRVPILSTELVTLGDVAVCDGGAVIAGSFTGTLRVGDKLVSTGGLRDGFVAALDAAGAVTQLVRMGGPGDDAFTAADCRGQELAAVGTFSAGAELRGVELTRLAEKTATPDGLVMKLRGGEVAWQRSFGGSREDLPADVALTSAGDIAVVGMARGELVAGPLTLTVGGLADGYLARWTADGTPRDALLIGGADYDATTRVIAIGERLAIAGFYSGAISLGGATFTARGGDDAMLVLVDGTALRALPFGGDGREEIAAMARAGEGSSGGDGLVLGLSHTAGFEAFGQHVAAPADPLGGATVVIIPAL